MNQLVYLAIAAAVVLSAGCDDETSEPSTTSSGSAGAGGAGGGSSCSEGLFEDIVADRTIEAGCVVWLGKTVSIRENATLTLEAGVRVEVSQGVSLEVGDSDTPGRLIANGTASAPILFTSISTSPAPGDWDAVEITDTALSGTSFNHVVFEYGGGNSSDSYPGALHFENPEELSGGRVSVDGCTFIHSAGAGIGMDDMASAEPPSGFFASFTGNNFAANTDYAIAARPNIIDSIGVGNSFDQPILVKQGDYDGDEAWPDLGVAYVLEGRLGLYESAAHLQLANVAVLGLTGSEITLEGGKLTATGVKFTSGLASPNAGDWKGIEIGHGGGSLQLFGCTISYATGGTSPDAVIYFAQQSDALASKITGTTFSDNIGPSNIQTQGSTAACAAFESASPANVFDLTPACL